MTVDRAAHRAVDRDLQQGLLPPDDGHDQGRERRPAAGQVRRRTTTRRPGRPRARDQQRRQAGGHQGRAGARRPPRTSPRTSTSRSCRRRCSARSTSRSSTRTSPPEKSLSDGDVIPASRVHTNVELQKILADLFPLLRSIRPADLSSTLYALATALRGRGNELGETHGEARLLPDHDERPPADAPAGPRAARPRQPDLRPGGPRPGPPAAQRHDHGAHRDRQGAAARDLHRRRDRPRRDLDAGADHERGQHRPRGRRSPGRCWACWTPTRRSSPACSRARRATPGGSTRSSGRARCGRACTWRPTSGGPTTSGTVLSTASRATVPSATACRTRQQPLDAAGQLQERHRARLDERGQPRVSHAGTPRPRLAAIKLGIFVLVSVIVTGTLTAIMGYFAFGSETEYKAEFTSASLITEGRRRPDRRSHRRLGQERRDQGPRRGRGHLHGQGATCRSPRRRTPPSGSSTWSATATCRWRRASRARARLADGGTIPISHTTPGAEPHRAVQRLPAAVPGADPERGQPALAEPGKVLQGEGGTIGSLMSNTASLTNTLADRDQLIGQVIDNLSAMLKTVDDRHQQLSHARRRAEGLDDQPRPRPQGDRRVGLQPLRPHRRGGPPAHAGQALPQGRRRPAAPGDEDA